MNRRKVDNINKMDPKKPGDVFESIHTIMHLFRSEQYRVFRDSPYKLTHLEGKLLGFFSRSPGATLKDLVCHTKQDKGQLAKLIKSLREQGLLCGQSDESDRRTVRLTLTPEGEAVHKAIRHKVGLLSKVAIKGLSSDERQQLADLLGRVKTNLEEI